MVGAPRPSACASNHAHPSVHRSSCQLCYCSSRISTANGRTRSRTCVEAGSGSWQRQQRLPGSQGRTPNCDLLAARQRFVGPGSAQLTHRRQYGRPNGLSMGQSPAGGGERAAAVHVPPCHHHGWASLHWRGTLSPGHRPAGVASVARPTQAAGAVFSSLARSILRSSPRQLFRTLARLIVRAARPLLSGPGSVVRPSIHDDGTLLT